MNGHDRLHEGTWTTASGEALLFNNFPSDEPNGLANENCLQSRGSQLGWNDIACDSDFKYICEIRK